MNYSHFISKLSNSHIQISTKLLPKLEYFRLFLNHALNYYRIFWAEIKSPFGFCANGLPEGISS